MGSNKKQVKQYIHTHRRETNKARIHPLRNGPPIGQYVPSEVATFCRTCKSELTENEIAMVMIGKEM